MADQTDYDLLTKRIAALDKDIGLELDGERSFALVERRANLEKQRSDLETVTERQYRQYATESDAEQMMDARLLMTENTLRGLDSKMDKLIDQVHDLDIRQRLLEQQVTGMRGQVDDLRAQVGEMRGKIVVTTEWGNPTIPREYMVVGAILVLVVLILLVLITWKVL